ncbi:MAG: glycerol-3-phosphate acyltransferase PlsY [Candidatus Midichloriaceae bacterium]|jgi:glycerol-3-phosphate acyltransferase PlsY
MVKALWFLMYNIDILLIIISYVIGSIPSGVILSKILKIGDIRGHGSGNIGATNAFRVGGKLLGGLTLFFDVLKGLIPIILAKTLGYQLVVLYGLVSVIGHIFPIWLKFRGGKGVATVLGVIFGVYPFFGIIFVVLWITIFKIFRISSLASLFSLPSIVAGSYFINGDNLNSKILFICCIFVLLKHKDNIFRLIKGTEKKIN